MAKMPVTDEVRVLRFFETGPIDKVEVLFNIVCEKMRERLRGRSDEDGASTKRQRRRKAEELSSAPTAESE